ncbi:MAG TPA: hypothetical protein VH475_29175 [Tepidisphaeraceae bacterium]
MGQEPALTPDKPYTLVVCIIGSILVYVLPLRYALLPLALSISMWPSNLLLPPDSSGLTAQRVIGFLLLVRCLTNPGLRAKYKWNMADWAAVFYFVMLTISQILTQGPAKAINNRGGFFLSALVPFWCVRMLITDKESFYALIKGWMWGCIPLAAGGVYQFITGNSPFFELMQYGVPKILAIKSQRLVDMRMMFGELHYRASCPFLQCIMFGWFFALLVGLGTNLFWQKRKVFPWIIPWCVLPVGIVVSIAGGPMMLAALSMAIIGLFPFRAFWKPACWSLLILLLVMGAVSNRNPLEILANSGFDQTSSWYRVGLQKYTLSGGMGGHWIAGYGDIPGEYAGFHDLCIHWIYLVVINGLMGAVGFYVWMAACAWQLWVARSKAVGIEDQWLVWTLLAVWIASVMSMFVVSLFGEMYFIYHMFLGLLANAPIMVGGGLRHVGVLAEVDGKPVLLRYALKQGQRLAVVHPGQPPVVSPQSTR